MSKNVLRKIITKFEENKKLDGLSGRVRKYISSETADEVSVAIVDRASYTSTRVRVVSCESFILWSTV